MVEPFERAERPGEGATSLRLVASPSKEQLQDSLAGVQPAFSGFQAGGLLAVASRIALHFALRLGAGNTADVTLLPRAIEGGNVYADVISVLSGGEHFAHKHLGPPKYEDLILQVGLAISDEFFDWVAGSWGPQPTKKSGAVLGLDFNFNIKSERAFAGVLIAEVTIPALDAASKETGFLTLRLQPEFIELNQGAGKLSLVTAKQKLWRTANFRLNIAGLDCTKVSKIESFSVKREITVVTSGTGEITITAGKVEFPNLSITLSELSAQSWFEWHHSFVVDGNNGDGFEKEGSLRFLAVDGMTELSRIDLHNLGIIKVAPTKAGGNAIGHVTADLYCERMELKRTGGNP